MGHAQFIHAVSILIYMNLFPFYGVRQQDDVIRKSQSPHIPRRQS
jgi:hypothetical protein